VEADGEDLPGRPCVSSERVSFQFTAYVSTLLIACQ
jgi:hypothetical protein